MEKRTIPFSPPDITDLEAEEVIKALKFGWITTTSKTKLIEHRLSTYIVKAQCKGSIMSTMT